MQSLDSSSIKKLFESVRALCASDDGFAVAEYAIVISGVSVAIIGSMVLFTSAMNGTYSRTTDDLSLKTVNLQ